MFPVNLGLPVESNKRKHSPEPEDREKAVVARYSNEPPSETQPSSSQALVVQVTPGIERPIVPFPSLLQRFKQFVQTIFTHTTYGKDLDELLSSQKNFNATLKENGDLLLTNYGEALRTRPPLKGVCNDLSYSFGTILQKAIGSHYEIRIGTGACKEYFPHGTHYFVVAWPKRKHDEVMKALADKKPLPDYCTIFDPSFKKVVSSKHKELWDTFKLKEVNSIETFHPDNMNNCYTPGTKLPIGFVRDLAPEMVSQYGDKALLFLKLQKNTTSCNMPDLVFEVQRDPYSMDYEPAQGLMLNLPFDHPLTRFHDKLFFDMLYCQSTSTDISPVDGELPDIVFPELDFSSQPAQSCSLLTAPSQISFGPEILPPFPGSEPVIAPCPEARSLLGYENSTQPEKWPSPKELGKMNEQQLEQLFETNPLSRSLLAFMPPKPEPKKKFNVSI
ncbi:MAG: hypothetical protein K0Q50_426 [Vampirovibrio sp.]|jgi:hypothetical protein|nr:hypothetical protein [Vampirovibrio sp.]